MNATDIPVQDLAPTLAPGPDGSGSFGQGVSVNTSTESASSSFSWEIFCFFLLWSIACATVVWLWIWSCCMCHRYGCDGTKQREEEQSTTDPEATEKEDVEHANPNVPEVEGDNACKRSHTCTMVVMTLSNVIAFILSIFAHTSCQFLEPVDNFDFVDSLGLWQADLHNLVEGHERGVCYSTFKVSYYQADTPQVVARVFATLATVVGGMVMVGLLVTTFSALCGSKTCSRCYFCRFSKILLWVAAFQAIPLCFKGTEICQSGEGCSLGFGALAAITASVYWYLAA
ncbi:MAG: hypothetical protein SGILL_006983, partial [Bacillariaceae sp.]